MPNLAWNIEQFLQQQKKEQEIFDEIFSEIKNIDTDSEAIVLGCTHYSHVKNIFAKIFPKQKIICPSEESAKKLKKYLQKHTEIDKNLSKNGEVRDISE